MAAGDFYQALQVYHGLCSRAKLAGDVEGKETSAETIALVGSFDNDGDGNVDLFVMPAPVGWIFHRIPCFHQVATMRECF